MLKSIASEEPDRYFGSSRKSLLSKTLLAPAGHGAVVLGTAPPGQPSPGMMTPLLTAGRGGTVMWLPSTPMRKLFEAFPPALQAPVSPGLAHTERSPN